MPHALHASRRVLTIKSHPPPRDSIWISDAHLAETFHRFACTHRRYGSHVPGPMEARRRANKRKNTSLAQLGPGPLIDPALLFSASPESAWWQTPTPVVKAPGTGPRLSDHGWRDASRKESGLDFLLPRLVQRHPNPPAATRTPIFQPSMTMKPAQEEARITRKRFEQQLQDVDSLDGLRSLIYRLQLDFSQNPCYSELAFEHVLSHAQMYHFALEFLLNPMLNPSSASNYVSIIRDLTEQHSDHKRYETLLQIVFHGFRVGLVPLAQAEAILKALPDIQAKAGNDDDAEGKFIFVKAGDTPLIHEYYLTILTSLADCNVFTVKDLGLRILKMWIERVYESPINTRAAALILSLENYIASYWSPRIGDARTSAKNKSLTGLQVSAYISITAQWLHQLSQLSPHRPADVQGVVNFLCDHQAPDAPQQIPRDETKLQFFDTRVSRLSAFELRLVIMGVSEKLLASVHKGMLSSNIFNLWEQVLGGLDNEALMKMLNYNVEKESCKLIDTSLAIKQRLLLHWWTALVVSKRSHRWQFYHQLREQFGNGECVQDSKKFFAELQFLPQPVSHKLTCVLDEYHKSLAREEYQLAKKAYVARKFTEHSFALLLDDSLYRDALLHLPETLQDLSASINRDLPGFTNVVLPFVATDKLSFRVVTRLLDHNADFKIALSRSWSTARKPQVDPTAGSVANMTHADGAFRRQVLSFMHSLAIAFALSPVITPRMALRKVFWCFCFLHRYGAPVHRPLTMAMWHAAVTRVESRGTSQRTIAWLLRKVRETEGDKAAELLMTSKEFRKTRAMTFRAWGRELGLVNVLSGKGDCQPQSQPPLDRRIRKHDSLNPRYATEDDELLGLRFTKQV